MLTINSPIISPTPTIVIFPSSGYLNEKAIRFPIKTPTNAKDPLKQEFPIAMANIAQFMYKYCSSHFNISKQIIAEMNNAGMCDMIISIPQNLMPVPFLCLLSELTK